MSLNPYVNRRKFTGPQIRSMLLEAREVGVRVTQLKYGVSDPTWYAWSHAVGDLLDQPQYQRQTPSPAELTTLRDTIVRLSVELMTNRTGVAA